MEKDACGLGRVYGSAHCKVPELYSLDSADAEEYEVEAECAHGWWAVVCSTCLELNVRNDEISATAATLRGSGIYLGTRRIWMMLHMRGRCCRFAVCTISQSLLYHQFC